MESILALKTLAEVSKINITALTAIQHIAYRDILLEDAQAGESSSAELISASSSNHRIAESSNRRITESTNHRIAQSSNHRITESSNHRITKSTNHRGTESSNHRISESPNEEEQEESTEYIPSILDSLRDFLSPKITGKMMTKKKLTVGRSSQEVLALTKHDVIRTSDSTSVDDIIGGHDDIDRTEIFSRYIANESYKSNHELDLKLDETGLKEEAKSQNQNQNQNQSQNQNPNPNRNQNQNQNQSQSQSQSQNQSQYQNQNQYENQYQSQNQSQSQNQNQNQSQNQTNMDTSTTRPTQSRDRPRSFEATGPSEALRSISAGSLADVSSLASSQMREDLKTRSSKRRLRKRANTKQEQCSDSSDESCEEELRGRIVRDIEHSSASLFSRDLKGQFTH